MLYTVTGYWDSRRGINLHESVTKLRQNFIVYLVTTTVVYEILQQEYKHISIRDVAVHLKII
jgi:hypothetical protein